MPELNEQEAFWRGEFGDQYVDRNNGKDILVSDIRFFSRILSSTAGIHSVLEFGSNIGLNLMAIRTLIPDVECSAVEINHKAAQSLETNAFFADRPVHVYEESLLKFENGGGRKDNMI